MQHGFDLSASVEKPQSNLSDIQKVVIESSVQDFHHGIDMGDLNDEYRANIDSILGLTGWQYRLPEHVHMELARKLLDADNYRNWIESTLRNAREGNIQNLSLAQMENVANIIDNWLRLHPFN